MNFKINTSGQVAAEPRKLGPLHAVTDETVEKERKILRAVLSQPADGTEALFANALDDSTYCGSHLEVPPTDFKPRSVPWDSNVLLKHLGNADLIMPSEGSEALRAYFWNDLCSEYDAENFCQYLDRRTDIQLSPEFRAFEAVWRRDELNHYIGFRKMCSLLFGDSEHELVQKVSRRKVDFSPLEPFLQDEFMLTLVLAYDEIVTTRAYASDYDLYRSFGHSNFHQWIAQVTKDEALHFHNCMEVIQRRHPDRIPEIPERVARLVQWDLEGGEYSGTFVLDHDAEQFTPDFLESCARKMSTYFKGGA